MVEVQVVHGIELCPGIFLQGGACDRAYRRSVDVDAAFQSLLELHGGRNVEVIRLRQVKSYKFASLQVKKDDFFIE